MKANSGYIVMTKGRGFYMVAAGDTNSYIKPILSKNGVELWLGLLG